MHKIFTMKLGDDFYSCNATDCQEKTMIEVIFNTGNTHHTFGLCKKHIKEFKKCVDEGYEKIEEYFKFEQKQKEELEEKKKNLFLD